MPKNDKWKGVRPVRFRKEVFELVKMLALKPTSMEEIRSFLIKMRSEREALRIKPLLLQRSTKNKLRKRPVFLTKAEQVVRVLKRISLIKQNNELIVLTERGIELARQLVVDELVGQTLFLQILLNSPYTTYWKFLNKLVEKSITIPSDKSKRSKEVLSNFLTSIGFPLDSWSFYILRDFFYDFDLVNYLVTAETEEVFPLYNLGPKSQGFSQKVMTPNSELWYWRNIKPMEFASKLSKVYLKLAGSWNRIIDLVKLREIFSREYLVSERQFNMLLKEAMSTPLPFNIIPSVGNIRPKGRAGYLTKVITLPFHSGGLPYTLLRLEPQDGSTHTRMN